MHAFRLNDDLPGGDDDVVVVRNARLLAQRCREGHEVWLVMAAPIAQALAMKSGIDVDAYAMSGGAIAELIDHMADRYEDATCSRH